MPGLTNEWREWIAENSKRGCTIESLFEVMVEKGFDRQSIEEEVHLIFNRQSTDLSSPLTSPNPADSVVTSAGGQSGQANTYVYESPRFPQGKRSITTHDRTVHILATLVKPFVTVLDGVLSHDECDELVALSQARLRQSVVVDAKTGQDVTASDRTSQGTWFERSETGLIARLDRRISEIMCLPVEYGENLQILHYGEGNEYKPHFDYFPYDDPGSKVSLARGGQRVSTMVIYLNDVEVGGETAFPAVGLSVAPRKGGAVYFEYCNSMRQVDPLTLHAGLPVLEGEKWIATKWMREGPFA